ncbi:TonB-dependent hemoglobin/transferrin/lactoferrin family receptor [Deefgea rivuli]|uniref:TonB-dependent hemoglobin/transferrin/lactoferrin family receptor n=1 Tax=Deefgea rivuli TaxID=400948 RepID=UPI000486238D|nr:TonB-dependent hemoglobin/transferrin/lactoferrin family receptor [Deefgea rivuli]
MKGSIFTLTLLSISLQHAFAAEPMPAKATATKPVAAEQIAFNQLDPIVVTATRTERNLADLPPSVSATQREELDANMINDFRDFARSEPGVNISKHSRFGLSSVNIRGLESNRVLMLVDGIRLPDVFTFGAYLNSGRDQVDFAQLSAIEVVRGPASTLYGSDALGGVVGMRTTEPTDLLQAGQTVAGQIKADYGSADQSYGAQGAVAFAVGENTLGLVQVAGRRGHELENMGDIDIQKYGRTTANPQDTEKRSALVKLQHYLDGGHKLGLTAEAYRSEVDTMMYTEIGAPMLTSVQSSRASDEQDRRRISLDYSYVAPEAGGLIDGAQAKIYRQTMDSTQSSYQVRQVGKVVTPNWSRVSTYEQDLIGASGLIEKQIAGDVSQRWTVGAEWFQTDFSDLRDGTPASSSLNVRDIPKTKTTQWGIYAQNELGFDDGRFTLTPGLRYDSYDLSPDVDKQFSSGGGKATALKDSAVSPKLVAAWQLADKVTVFGQYSSGFRAPNALELNGSYVSPMGYAAIANPDLKPETSRGFEFGSRFGDNALGGSVTAFDNRYDDFIEQASINCPGKPACVPGTFVTYQSQNISEARIYGAEARLHWQFAEGWQSWGNVAWAKGTNESNDKPLGSVAPLKGVLGVSYSQSQWGSQLLLTAVEKQTETANATDFQAPGYGLLDLTAWWSPVKNLTLTGGIFNITDKKYWIDSDVRSIAASTPYLDRLTQAGRNVRIAADWKF